MRVAWSVVRSVGLSVTVVSCAEMAEPIKMSFELRTREGPRNHVLDGSRSPHGKGSFEGGGRPIVKYWDTLP